jgi:hypothetical protein
LAHFRRYGSWALPEKIANEDLFLTRTRFSAPHHFN